MRIKGGSDRFSLMKPNKKTQLNYPTSLFFFLVIIMAFAATQTGPRPVLLQIEDQFNKRIDDDVVKLVDCFTDIVKVGEVSVNKKSLGRGYLPSCLRIKIKISLKLHKKDTKWKAKLLKL